MYSTPPQHKVPYRNRLNLDLLLDSFTQGNMVATGNHRRKNWTMAITLTPFKPAMFLSGEIKRATFLCRRLDRSPVLQPGSYHLRALFFRISTRTLRHQTPKTIVFFFLARELSSSTHPGTDISGPYAPGSRITQRNIPKLAMAG